MFAEEGLEFGSRVTTRMSVGQRPRHDAEVTLLGAPTALKTNSRKDKAQPAPSLDKQAHGALSEDYFSVSSNAPTQSGGGGVV
jgi:hypothetical protein